MRPWTDEKAESRFVEVRGYREAAHIVKRVMLPILVASSSKTIIGESLGNRLKGANLQELMGYHSFKGETGTKIGGYAAQLPVQ